MNEPYHPAASLGNDNDTMVATTTTPLDTNVHPSRAAAPAAAAGTAASEAAADRKERRNKKREKKEKKSKDNNKKSSKEKKAKKNKDRRTNQPTVGGDDTTNALLELETSFGEPQNLLSHHQDEIIIRGMKKIMTMEDTKHSSSFHPTKEATTTTTPDINSNGNHHHHTNSLRNSNTTASTVPMTPSGSSNFTDIMSEQVAVDRYHHHYHNDEIEEKGKWEVAVNPTRAKELEVMKRMDDASMLLLPREETEQEDQQMMQMAMKLSLHDESFRRPQEKSNRNHHSNPRQQQRQQLILQQGITRRSTSVPTTPRRHLDTTTAEQPTTQSGGGGGADDDMNNNGATPPIPPPPPLGLHGRSNSHRSLYSSGTLEMTEVVVEDPRGRVKSSRRISTRNLMTPITQEGRIEASAAADTKLQAKSNSSSTNNGRIRNGDEDNDDDPKAHFFYNDPKAQLFLEQEHSLRPPASSNNDDVMSHWDQDDVRKKFFDEELDEEMFSEVPRLAPTLLRRRGGPQQQVLASSSGSRPVDQIRPIDQILLARQNLSPQEAEEIERALREAGEVDYGDVGRNHGSTDASPQSRHQSVHLASMTSSPSLVETAHLSADEAAEIAKALKEADEAEARKSFQLALQLQSQEATLFTNERNRRAATATPQGNVRTISRDDYAAEQAAQVGAVQTYSPPVVRHPLDVAAAAERADAIAEPGYRINSSTQSQSWARVRDHVVGPNNEVRTKHDAELQAQANARRLGLDDEDEGFVGNTAYNSFRHSMQRQTVKGVAAHGHGRAMSDTDKTKSGAMDQRVRMLITRAINNRLIEKCNGIVREGKEAVIYHADEGEEGGGYDVAIKVFKRIEEFRGRGDFVDGDPRFRDGKFRNASGREQLEMWAEKEYRNLLRANRAGVPVPTPLIQKENVVFMRFLGEDGWAVPQLKDLQIRKGSDKWTTLYSQIMVAIRRLFHGARLVHGDLSEHNILVCPARLVENRDEGFGPDDDNELQAVLIDFGQAVDWQHPLSMELLERDLAKIRDFFLKKSVKTLAINMALEFVTAPEPDNEDESSSALDTEEASYSKMHALVPGVTVVRSTTTTTTNNATTNYASSPNHNHISLPSPQGGGTAAATVSPLDDESPSSHHFMPSTTTNTNGKTSWGQGADVFQHGSSWPAEWGGGSFSDFDKK